MAKNDSFIKLKNDIKNNSLGKLYVFIGEETYLRDLYTKKIINTIDDAGLPEFNRIIIENGRDSVAELPEILEGFPMMTDKRVVCIKDTGIFKKADDKIKEYLCTFFKHLSDDSIIIFIENETDKRSAVYKAAAKYGQIVEFTPLSTSDTVAWLIREARAHKLTLSHTNAEYMLTICDNTLGSLHNELDKLSGFCTDEITKSDIDRIVSKSLQVQVFELCDYMIARNADKALMMLRDLKTVKEPAFKILYLLFGTFDKIFHAKLLLASSSSQSDIASQLKLPPFITGKYIKSAAGFSDDELIHLLTSAAVYDLKIKQGEMDDWTALEQYVCSYFSK